MKTSIFLALLLSSSLYAQAESTKDGGLSRIFIHRDGSRTESVKMGNSQQLKESTYNKNKLLISSRLFVMDTSGRLRRGVIFDGRENPLGTILYNFDKVTGKTIEERTYNKEGKLIMRLMYPGTLADPRFANRYVAFHYDPNDPNAKPVQDTKNAKPLRPIDKEQDSYDSGLPLERPADTAPKKLQPAPHVPPKPEPPAPAKPTTPPKSILPARTQT